MTEMDPRNVYGKVIFDALTDMAADCEEMAKGLRRLATHEVPRIGEKQGLTTLTATDIVTDALRMISRNNPSVTKLVRAAADYELNIRDDHT